MTNENHRGFTIWFTGLSGSGKTTLSLAIAQVLEKRGLPVEIFDGDMVRKTISKGLGYSREDRIENNRRIGVACRQLTETGQVAIAAVISPYQEGRETARKLHPEGSFIEIYLECPLEILKARDAKGLYQKALRGEIPFFTGISDPYEPPENPELLIRTDHQSVEESLGTIMAWLEQNGLLPSETSRSGRGIDKEQGKPQP